MNQLFYNIIKAINAAVNLNFIRDFKQLTTPPPKWSTGSKNALLASTAKAKD